LFFFDVATLDESVVTLGRHRQAVARSRAATLPDYEQWQCGVSDVGWLSNPGTICGRCSPLELKRSLDAPSQDTDPEIDPRYRPKFAECIPEHLLGFFARQRLYNWDAANHVLRSNIVDVTSRRTPTSD
jgi:hypothetical protein